ncbi:spore maturation protein A [Natranaerovirga hydrolytica]|uniref:Spore maturation protein A n=1 Tax=Natranaerovirga hydrolytica TaxID=680378 RepID=A0A4R1N682_9FIRM|nr:nucleoside recognition protein [Natranaerovirga hydrolytica]TCL00046.1 spore maturation protein A [Natranaerovirga hydrolytica]
MLNYLWAYMIIFGIIIGAINGNMPEVTQTAIDSSKEAVQLCITLVGVISLWTGLMKIAEESGLIKSLTEKMKPILRFLFPNIPDNHPSKKYIATNMIANILGLGWAATPPGLKAMEKLQEINPHKEVASKEMCTFLIINISSVQLLPINIIAYRSQYQSANPAEIIGPAILATIVSTCVGVIFAKVMMKRSRV